MCIPKGCYVFNMTDTSGDGICCGYGAGSYSLEVDGVSLVSEGGEFLHSAFALFGNCLSVD
jgi:lysyl endopeptidase